jgi:hypothetical protein
MAASAAAELRAATRGRTALEDYLASTPFDPEQFTSADHAAFAGAWSWLGAVAARAIDGRPGGMMTAPRRWTHFGPQLRRGGHGLLEHAKLG